MKNRHRPSWLSHTSISPTIKCLFDKYRHKVNPAGSKATRKRRRRLEGMSSFELRMRTEFEDRRTKREQKYTVKLADGSTVTKGGPPYRRKTGAQKYWRRRNQAIRFWRALSEPETRAAVRRGK